MPLPQIYTAADWNVLIPEVIDYLTGLLKESQNAHNLGVLTSEQIQNVEYLKNKLNSVGINF
jgi:hypothetical protein